VLALRKYLRFTTSQQEGLHLLVLLQVQAAEGCQVPAAVAGAA
jgi:hypothetical protein